MTGRDFKYNQALNIIQSESYINDIDDDFLRRKTYYEILERLHILTREIFKNDHHISKRQQGTFPTVPTNSDFPTAELITEEIVEPNDIMSMAMSPLLFNSIFLTTVLYLLLTFTAPL